LTLPLVFPLARRFGFALPLGLGLVRLSIWLGFRAGLFGGLLLLVLALPLPLALTLALTLTLRLGFAVGFAWVSHCGI
jgi:hypothetical protein